MVRRREKSPGDSPKATKVRSWVIACVLAFLQRHNPAYNGEDPTWPRIEIDRDMLNNLPGLSRDSDGCEVDWATFLDGAVSVPPEMHLRFGRRTGWRVVFGSIIFMRLTFHARFLKLGPTQLKSYGSRS